MTQQQETSPFPPVGTLNEAALAYARECLGLADVEIDGAFVQTMEAHSQFRSLPRWMLNCMDLSDVLYDACAWWDCDRDEGPSRRITLHATIGVYCVAVMHDGFEAGFFASQNPCHAILAACVHADRTMKGLKWVQL